MEKLENKGRIKGNTVKVILNVPEDILTQYKDLSLKRGICRSSMMIYAMSWYLDYNKSLDLMPQMLDALKSMPENISDSK